MKRCLIASAALTLMFRNCLALTPLPIDCLAVSPDNRIVAANLGAGIDLYDLQTGTKYAQLDTIAHDAIKAGEPDGSRRVLKSSVRRIAFAPDSKHLLCTTYDSDAAVIVWDVVNVQQPIFIKSEMFALCDDAVFTREAKQLLTFMRASPNGDDTIIAWDTVKGTEIWRRKLGIKIRDAHFSSNGEILLVNDVDGKSLQQDPETGKIVPPGDEKPTDSTIVPARLEFHGKELHLLAAGTGKATTLTANDEIRMALLTTNHLAIARMDLGLQVWDAQTGKLLFNFSDANATQPK